MVTDLGSDEDREAARVEALLASADRFQEKGRLREAIDAVERGTVDYPLSQDLRTRLAELRFQRQVCFVDDWNEAETLASTAPAQAVTRLERIERYGDRDMVRRARARIEEIRAGSASRRPAERGL